MFGQKNRSRIRLSHRLQAELHTSDRLFSYKIALVCLLVAGAFLTAIIVLPGWKAQEKIEGEGTVLGLHAESPLQDSYLSYTVRKPDTIFSLSARFKVPWNELVRTNNLREPYDLHEGQQLLIPRNVSGVHQRYRIQSGDTLTAIAKKFQTTPEDILLANTDILSANTLSVGKEILIPVVRPE